MDKQPKRSTRGRTAIKLAAAAGAGVLIGLSFRRASISFHGKSVVIFGASRGLGLLLARRLADEGARLTLAARSQEQLAHVAQELAAKGAQVLTLPCDVRDRSAVESVVARAVERYGTLDLLVNTTGIIRAGPVERMGEEDFKDHFDVHFWGTLYSCMAALPHMKRQGGGSIVNVSSFGGKVAVPHLVPYSASKFAAAALSEGLAAELAKYGVKVTTVYPWLMRTGSPLHAQMKGVPDKEYRWFLLAASVPPVSLNADRVADRILKATRRGDRRLVVGPQAKVALLADELFPRPSGFLMRTMNRLLPAPGSETGVKTGHEIDEGPIVSFLSRLTERAARRHRQIEAAER